MAALDIISSVFSSVWGIFTGLDVPGLNVSFGALFLAVVLIRISISIIRLVFGFGGGTGYRSGSSRNPKIAKERQGDFR